ncbi:Phage tail sheath protein [Enhygromyxa salina]|uniref:Phage tail sheath protein n=2 Tax=Enhygromyxa salina TaxID=215803 RepID=A0A2S9YVA0_9BACT|nr:Phage tail sheath protein [Enhygromyxa salina]
MRTLSYTEFERTFGATNSLGELHDQVKQFFLNGGSTAWVIRIAQNATKAAIELFNTDATKLAVLTLTAVSAGVIGNSLRVHVDYDTPTPEMTFNIRIDLAGVDSGGAPITVASELFKNLSMNPTDGNYAVTSLNQNSNLVSAALHDDAPDAHSGYAIWGTLEVDNINNTNLDDVLTSVGGTGRFLVSADNGPYVTVTLGAKTVGAVKDAIELALAPQGKTVTVTMFQMDDAATYYGYRISAGSGGRIRFAKINAADDIGEAMGMPAEYGALEVDGYARNRPAPSGLFSKLRLDSDANFQGSFGDFLVVDPDTITVEFTDSVVTDEAISPIGWTTDTTLALDGATPPTLQNLQNNLDALIAAASAVSAIDWSFERQGHRLVAYANYGGDNGDTSGVLASGAAVAVFDGYFDAATNFTRYQFSNQAAVAYQDGAGAGSNGSRPIASDYSLAFAKAERDIDLFNILVLPRAEDQSDAHRQELWGPASVFAKNRRSILLVDPDASWTDVAAVTSNIANLRIGVATDHAAVYWPRIKVSAGGVTKSIDPSGAMAGVMARTDVSRGVWKAPAGLEANLLGVRGVEHSMSDGDNGTINPLAVNAIRVFPNGVVSWGARTMVGFDNSGNDDYKYLPIRRLALYIEESLFRGLKWAVFEPNDEPLWRQIGQTAGAFMNNLFRLGAFAGGKKSDAYFVKVDRETTTQNDVNLGIVNVVIGFAPLKPAEFVVITLQQQAGEVQT